MSLHDAWVDAKKKAWKDFKEAQKNYLKEQDKKINATNDAKARKKALDMVLGDAGLDKGESLDDYLKFADGFGKSLDALEKSIDKNAELTAKYDLNGGIDKLLQNKDLAKQLLLVCQRTHSTNIITLYLKDHKKSPQDVWQQYVEDGTADQIELSNSNDGSLFSDWQQAAQDGTLAAQGNKLIERLRDHAKYDLQSNAIPKMISDATARKNLGYVPKATIDALKKDVKDTAQKYDGQIDAAAKKWKNLKPQFWQPLDDTLQSIMAYVDSH